MKSYQELVSAYFAAKDNLTEHQRAEFEYNIAEAAVQEKIKPIGEPRTDFLVRVLKGVRYYVANRMFLYSRDHDIAELWRRVNDGLPVKSAVNLYRTAKIFSRSKNVEFSQALRGVLADYDRQPVTTSKSGGVFHKKFGNKHARATHVAPVPIPPPPPPVEVRVETVPTPEVKSTREFWPAIRSLCTELVDDRLKDCDPIVAGRVKADFLTDISVLLDEYQSRISRTTKTYSGVVIHQDAMSLKEINTALAVLHLDPIKRMGCALKGNYTQSFRTLAKQYHPDQNKGREEQVRPLFEEVRTAKSTLDQYVELYVTKTENGVPNA